MLTETTMTSPHASQDDLTLVRMAIIKKRVDSKGWWSYGQREFCTVGRLSVSTVTVENDTKVPQSTENRIIPQFSNLASG
jgi:uncharacterized protein YqfB (UPF0267 family)